MLTLNVSFPWWVFISLKKKKKKETKLCLYPTDEANVVIKHNSGHWQTWKRICRYFHRLRSDRKYTELSEEGGETLVCPQDMIALPAHTTDGITKKITPDVSAERNCECVETLACRLDSHVRNVHFLPSREKRMEWNRNNPKFNAVQSLKNKKKKTAWTCCMFEYTHDFCASLKAGLLNSSHTDGFDRQKCMVASLY